MELRPTGGCIEVCVRCTDRRLMKESNRRRLTELILDARFFFVIYSSSSCPVLLAWPQEFAGVLRSLYRVLLCFFFWVLYRVSYRSSVGLIECFELRMACAGEIASIGQRSVALLSSPPSSFVLSLSPSLSFTSLTHSMLRFGARSFTLNRLSVQTGWIWDCCSTGLNWLSLNFTEFYWMLLGFTRLYWLSFNLARLYWVLLGFTGFY